MANIKISALPSATTINGADLHVIVQGGVTKKISDSVLQNAANANIDNLFGEGYSEPSTFFNGFAQDPTTPLKVVITGHNNKAVYFRGLLDCSLVTFTPGTFVQAFRLPTNARPKVISHFPIIGLYDAIGICAVHPDGYVYFKNLTGDLSTSGIIDLANISFYIDPF